jgi:glucose-1-phosphate cytidylyltransferase
MTGGRLKRVQAYVGKETFCMTYGDGVADLDLGKLIAFHREQGKLATVTAVQAPGRFGALVVEDSRVKRFEEKPHGDGGWINGGFFVLQPEVLDHIQGDETVWERGPIEKFARQGELAAFPHRGFWHAMDTLRDKNHLDEMWNSGKAPWKIWS